MYSILIALEKYVADSADKTYPIEIHELIQKGYLEDLPRNPFTGRPMQVIRAGASPFEGEFTYEPILTDGKAQDYKIYAYGSGRTEGQDIRPGVKHIIYFIQGPLTHHIIPERKVSP